MKIIVAIILVVALAFMVWMVMSSLFSYALLILAAVGIVALVGFVLNVRYKNQQKVPVGSGREAARRERTAQRELKNLEKRIDKP